MHLSRSALYAFRLSLNQSGSAPVYRSGGVDRKTVRSALLLATAGLSLSSFSLKQMLSSPAQQRRLRRINSSIN
ncbi:uncharacterized protein LOC125502247 [Athalia rosae]|uniref:uncharacterized protein LOC125502247 n=1 Tax=Athalia rosae TaxID=37344 RepID=UPI00203460B8|nr:uncharacterized protein LOC125502247 [Athalia rosae]